MTSSDKEVEEQLLEAGNKIEDPPTSVEELLSLLDKIDSLLAKVEQSPSKSVHNALNPSRKALVSDQLLRHSDIDVKVAVAACISEITRITAPEAPYTDEQMKEVFHLIVSSFENLSDKSSRSYGKRASILETVAKVRSCVVMLDLECDGLIIEMFQHFLKTARDYHPENVFSSMETIMSLVLEESEDISVELLSPILASVKKENEEVLPIARKLGERVLNNCSAKLKPYLVQAVKTLGISFDDYSDVVASICKELSDSLEPNNLHDAGENVVEGNPTEVATPERVDVAIEKHHDSVKSNGIAQGGEDGSFTDTEKKEEEHGSEESKEVKSPKCSEPAKLDSEKASTAKAKPAKISKKRGRKSNQSLKSTLLSENSHVDTKKESENLPQQESCGEEHPSSPHGVQSAETLPLENEKVEVKPSSPKVTEIESANVASPSRSGSLPDDGNSKKVGLTKKNDNSAREVTSSADDVSRKLPEGVSDSDVKLDTHAEEKPPAGISDENKTASEEDAAERESDTSSNSEAKTLKQSARKVDKTSKGSSRPLKQSEAKKRQGPGISDDNKTASDEDAGESQSDTSSNSDAKTLKQSVRKVDKTSKGSSGPLKQLEAKKRQGPGKSVSGKAMKKLSGDHDKKETVTSPKPTLKTIKDEKVLDKATKASSSKRKRTPGKEKDSESTKFDETLVGSKIQVWWPKDRMFYEGVVEDYDHAKKKHKVLYMDGDTEVLNLKKERWEFIDDESGSEREQTTDLAKPESAMDIPQKKKAKLTANESAKRGKMDGSPKKGGVTSSSKSKGTTVKPDRSSGSKVESKSKENLSKAVKSSTITGSKSKDHASRATGKTGNVAPKNANKSRNDLEDTDSHKTSKSSKDDETHTPVASAKSKQDISKTGKSKQETPKTPTFSKGKSSKTGDRSNNSNISTKVKFTSSKSKEGGDSKNNTASAKTTENSKGKSLNSSNDQGGESKTGKKRRREAKG